MSIISVQNLSKKYLIRHENDLYLTLRDRISHPIKTLKHKATHKPETFWAINDVSFDVEQGDVMGVIGSNGSGKSTLLKVLSQITPPTKGKAILRGKVASLLEVGTGFHGELTGRENIFMSGVILGMTKKEISKKFDEIVAFAGVEKFLDTPIKYYSSGMNVRLGFSVAAHLDTDILIIDEVLAVGDAEFQKKCLSKMDSVAKSQGRTILFVSHDMKAVKNICNKGICLKSGSIVNSGEINNVIDFYLNGNDGNSENNGITRDIIRTEDVSLKAKIVEFSIINDDKINPTRINSTKKINIRMIIETQDEFDCGVHVSIKSNAYDTLLMFDSVNISRLEFKLKKGQNIVNLEIDPTFLTAGSYLIDCGLFSSLYSWVDILRNIYTFSVPSFDSIDPSCYLNQSNSKYFVQHKWAQDS